MSSRPVVTARIKALWAIFVLGAAVIACQKEAPVESLSQAERFLDADGVIMGGEHTITNAEGIRTAYLQFDTMYQWEDSTNWHLRGVDLTVFNQDDGTQRGRVTSLQGVFDPEDEALTAQGNVVLVIPQEDRRLETEELHYDPEQQQLWSDSAFVMYEGSRTREGSCFTTDLEFRNFTVGGNVGGARCSR